MQEYSWLDIKFYCILLEQDWQIGGEDRWWGVMILGEDFVNCGCREVFVRLQYGTDDSTSPSTKASTFDPPLSIWCPSILVSRLVLLICWANFFGVVRSSSVSRAISFFSCHICSRRQLRAAAAGLFLFLFCTADRLTLETFSSHYPSQCMAKQYGSVVCCEFSTIYPDMCGSLDGRYLWMQTW